MKSRGEGESKGEYVFIRDFVLDDTEAIVRLYVETVRRVNSRDYAPEQIAVWAPDDIDVEEWRDRLENLYTYVAEMDGKIVGFIDLQPRGCIDCIYCHAEHQGIGIGSALLARCEKHAKAMGLRRLFTEASITARPFLENHGFTVCAEQQVTRNGVRFINYLMEKRI
jgi:N-acetylglutamate synthase-like GNAT family acetyltransferase